MSEVPLYPTAPRHTNRPARGDIQQSSHCVLMLCPIDRWGPWRNGPFPQRLPPRLHAPQRVAVARGRRSVTDHEARPRQHSPRIDRSARRTRGLNARRNVEEENVRLTLSGRRVSESVFGFGHFLGVLKS